MSGLIGSGRGSGGSRTRRVRVESAPRRSASGLPLLSRGQSYISSTPYDEAAAERELLRLCFVHAKDAAWAQWFHECVWLGYDSKVAALAFYRAWEAQGMARP
jgi:hypothetical protein